MKKTITREPFTGLPFGGVSGASAPVKPAAPTFTAQPTAIVLYQEGGKVTVNGANTDSATAYQWQKQNSDGSWGDVSGRTGKTISVASGDASWAGVFRLRAVNGNSDPAYSNLVRIYDVYLFMQNDLNNDPATVGVVQGADKYHWIDDGPAGDRYYSAYLRFRVAQALPDGTMQAADAAITTANIQKLGFSSGRMVASWASTNTTVVDPSASGVVAANGQIHAPAKASTSVTLTATFRDLSSQLAVSVP